MLTTRLSLIQRVRDPADRQAWNEFVHFYQPLLTAYVRKQGLRDHDAEDAVQSILMQLLRSLPKFELDHTRGRFRTFLWQITNHAVIDALRKRHRGGQEQQYDEQLSTLEKTAQEEPSDAWLADERRRIFQVSLMQVRETAQEKTWKCFEQHLLRGRPAAEVATELGISANVVYVNASRTLAKVREKCADFEEEWADD
jgi:RNA polymerase sigma-70 factor (ECF subfamily)